MSTIDGQKHPLEVRKPEFAGLYYPSDAQELNDQIEIKLMDAAMLGADLSELSIGGMIVPSAGFSYSAKIALSAYQKVMNRNYSRVILIGKAHFFSFSGLALTGVDAYQSPLGEVLLDKKCIEKLSTNFNFQYNENAFAKEYSLEVQLPYLQKFLKNFQLVPLLLGNKIDLAEVAAKLSEIIDDNTLVVVSTDLSHFLTDAKARKTDQDTINAILARDVSGVKVAGQALALWGVVLINEIALLKEWQPMFLAYGNTSEGGDDPDSVVGYASMIYLSE